MLSRFSPGILCLRDTLCDALLDARTELSAVVITSA